MATFLANGSDNSSSPEATSSVASRFTTPELDGTNHRSERFVNKSISVWNGRRADDWSIFSSAVGMADRQSFQTAGQHQSMMPTDLCQQHWQQHQQQAQLGPHTMENAAGGAQRSPIEAERGTVHGQQYLESLGWRLPSVLGAANNVGLTRAGPPPDYNMFPWQQQQQQQQQQQPRRLRQQVVGLSGMEGFYAYCFDRGDGTYTRLIPADMIPPLLNIPATQTGSEGMLVLPLPLRPPPFGPLSNVEPVTVLRTRPPSPEPGSDTIQKKIDHIVATTPASQKKPKIYCDKWVHEGVCAFTQQGCKYKHEMPLDKATQMSLGLFHGLPTWWKKQQAERQREQAEGVAISLGFGGDEAVCKGGGGGGGGDGSAGFGTHNMVHPRTLGAGPDRGGPLRVTRSPQAVSWRRADSMAAGTTTGTPTMRAVDGGGGMGTMTSPAYPQSMDGLRSPTTATEARPFSHQKSSPTSPCIFGPIGPPSRFGVSENGTTSHPSTAVMNTSRCRNGGIQSVMPMASRGADNASTARQRRMGTEQGQGGQQRQCRSEGLESRLDHLRL